MGPALSFAGALILAILSFILKRVVLRIDGMDGRMTSLDAMTHAEMHSLDQTTQARISSVEHVADVKNRESQAAQIIRDDAIVRMIMEHANEADRKYATVREMLNVQERLLAIDNNVRAVLTAIDRLAHGGN